MTYNEKKKIIERNRGRIYAGFDVHGMLRYDPEQHATDTERSNLHPNHYKALAALSNLTKEYLKTMIDDDYSSLITNEIKGVKA